MAAKLKTQKNAHLTHVSRAVNSLQDELKKDPPDADSVVRYIRMVDEKYAKVVSDSNKLQDVLEADADLEKEISDMDKLEDKIITIKHRAQRFLDSREDKTSKGDETLNATLNLLEQIKAENSQQDKESLKTALDLIQKLQEGARPKERSSLPPMTLPRFDGNIEKYTEFIDSYEAALQNHPDVSDVDRFMLLKNHLDKPASDLLAGFNTTNADFAEAYQLFKDTYGNKHLLRQIRISKLLNIEKHDGQSSLRSIYNQIRTHIRSLESLDVAAEDYSLFLIPIVLSKLSRDLNKKWYNQKDKESINKLLEWLQQEVESTESAIYLEDAFSTPTSKKVTSEKKYYKPNTYHKSQPVSHNNQSNYRSSDYRSSDYKSSNNQPSTATALNTTAQKHCYYCQKSTHDTQNCRQLEKLPSPEVRNFLKSQMLCFCCMKKNHSTAQCYHKPKLVCKVCKSNSHHTFLHNEKAGVTMSTVSSFKSVRKVLYQTAKANLRNEKHQTAQVTIVLDPCSDKSFITTVASNKIKLRYHTETIKVTGWKGKTDGYQSYRVRHAVIQSRHNARENRSIDLVETDKICTAIHREAIPQNLLDSKYLQGIQLAEDYSITSDDEIDILIGLDYYWEFVTGRVKRQKNKPIVIESILGWILQANTSGKPLKSPTACTLFISASEGKEINNQLKKFWEVEEVDNPNETQWSSEDKAVHKHFKETITHEEDGKYQVRLPVRDQIEHLSNNKSGAIVRHQSLMKRLTRNPELGVKYRAAMKEFIDNGFAEKVDEITEPNRCFYAPHHPVIKEDRSTTKVRPVFEGNASDPDSESLNDSLYTGPTLQPHLPPVLMRFRLNPIAFKADVKKMYPMVRVHPEDRDLLRFFWEDPDDKSMSVYRLTVLPFGLSCSPYLAIATVHHHLSAYENEYPHIVKELTTNTYIDDLLSGAESVEEAIADYETEVRIMKSSGMELHKFASNHPDLNRRFVSDKVSSPDDHTEIHDEQAVLGISWTSNDYFTFHEKGSLDANTEILPTKRNILKISGKLYDPCGWLSPYIVLVKMLIQKLWERGLEWDEKLPEDLSTKWENWREDLGALQHIKLPRYIGNHYTQKVQPVELHTFGDASEAAYASVTYLKCIGEDGEAHITLMYSKTKVAPVKIISLPRLELLAAFLAAKASAYVTSTLQLPHLEIYMWTDSKVALSWIKGTSRQYKTFVANRTQLIQELTEPSAWRWCPGEQNPADIPSRGLTLSRLKHNEDWWTGPKWLKHSASQYPQMQEDLTNNEAVTREMKKSSKVCLLTATESSKPSIKQMTSKLVDHKKYSKLQKLLFHTACIHRYLYNLMHTETRITGPINPTDIHDAEVTWLQFIQKHSFPEELQRLLAGKPVKNSSKILKLSPYYDPTDGLIKMGGRIQFSDLSEDEKHPVILPNESYIVKLLVEDMHCKQFHAGINHTLISLRYKYWILRARQLVKRVVKSCFICRKIMPVRLQVQIAPLPRERIMKCLPFEVVGIDWTGPLFVYQGNECNKMYICLFTCAVTRAVQLELLWNLTAESFTRSFRRFISNRGMCKTIWTDNAKTFQKSEKDIKHYLELMKGKAFQNYLTENRIEWKYIQECSPWWGGFYERLNQCIKGPLKKTLGKARLQVDEMNTLLKEIEAQINSRPLTTIVDEPTEQNYITPASFLIGKPTMNLPLKPRPTKPCTSDQKELNKALKAQNKYLDAVWRIWREEYLRNLGTVNNKVNHTDCVRIGEVVLVSQPSLPRTKWEVGVVEDLKEGRDGRIRSVRIRTKDGTIPRSVQHISRLEADSLEDYNQYAC